MESSDMSKLAIIGAGAMGSAFAKGVISAGLFESGQIAMADVNSEQLAHVADELGVLAAADNLAAIDGADIVLVAVKPGIVEGILEEIGARLNSNQLLISIAAGVDLFVIGQGLPHGIPVIRAMPNTPCLIGCGAIGFSRGDYAGDEHIAKARRLFDAVGISFELPDHLMDAVTGLSGSGPAYIYVAIEALSDAGVRVGLPRDISTKLAAQTVLGAARMVMETNEHPGRLKDKVTSPGGTTIAGIDALERAGFRSALIEAVKAATKRSEEL